MFFFCWYKISITFMEILWKKSIKQDNKEEDYNMVSHLGGGSANMQQKFF
jgi:hypothetical protein